MILARGFTEAWRVRSLSCGFAAIIIGIGEGMGVQKKNRPILANGPTFVV